MTTPAERDNTPPASCPVCGEAMRKEYDGVRQPPMPSAFWFCTNKTCADGVRNRLFQGG